MFLFHFEEVEENLKWLKEHWTLLKLQSFVIGKAREVHLDKTQINITKEKNLFLRLMSWSLRLIGRK